MRRWAALGLAGALLAVVVMVANLQRVSGVEAASPSPPPVSVAYGDTHHPPASGQFPSPWYGSPNVVFIGTTTNDWDGSAIKIDNITGADLPGVRVTMDIGASHYDKWGTNITIPAGQSLIVTQTDDVYADLDTSDYDPNPYSAYQSSGVYPTVPDCTPTSAIPVIHVTIGQTTFDYNDTSQVANRGGDDMAHCVGGDEAGLWSSLAVAGAPTPTPTSTATNTPTATSTATPTGTATATNTPIPTNTPTATPTNTPATTATPTNTPTPTATSTATPTPTNTPTSSSGDLAVGFAEASQQPGAWTVPGPYQLALNSSGSTGSRSMGIAYAAVTPGPVTGPTITNVNTQSVSGGSLLILKGSALAVHGTTPAGYVHGVTGGSSATIAAPSGMQAGDLITIYVNTGNATTTAPSGWVQQHHDGDGIVYTRAFASVPANLGTWTTSDSHGWAYTSVAFGATDASPAVVAVGGGGAQSHSAVLTGSATAP